MEQARVHEPQWVASVWRLTQTPPQRVWPPGQTHVPKEHAVPPVQARLHMRQWVASVCVARQAPLQACCPTGHAAAQMPSSYTRPVGQGRAVAQKITVPASISASSGRASAPRIGGRRVHAVCVGGPDVRRPDVDPRVRRAGVRRAGVRRDIGAAEVGAHVLRPGVPSARVRAAERELLGRERTA